MRVFFLNPSVGEGKRYIREGRCMQKASSWATLWPPIGLGTLAAIARKTSEVRLFDGNVECHSLTELIDEVRLFGPDLVVVNTGFPSIEEDMGVARGIKSAIPSVKLLAFGVYFTLLGKAGMEQYPFLDACLVGEPEQTFAEYLERLSQSEPDLSRVNGLGYRSGAEVVVNPERDLVKDLDAIPFPARDLLKNDRYRLPHNDKTFTLINTARGCPYQCTFCVVGNYYGDRLRKHSITHVIDEIRECRTQHGIEEFLFWEEVFTLDRGYCLQLCEAILSSGLSIRWAATTRVDLVDRELLRHMKRAGCYLLGLGIESSNQDILRMTRKGTTVVAITEAVQLCKQVGVKTMGHVIFGLPGETRDTAEATIRFILGLGLDYMQAYCAVPYPKTALGEQARASGWIRPGPWSSYDFGGDSVVDMPGLPAEDVTRYRDMAFRRFYLRPSYMAKTFVRDVRFRQLYKVSTFIDWMKAGRNG